MSHENTDYIQALRSRGYRVTSQRLIVLDAVCALHGHATVADIQAKVNEMDPTIDRSTIYRALDVLTAVGLVVEAEMGAAGKIYGVAGEAEHHHLVCLSCGKVLTIASDMLNPVFAQIHDRCGFEVRADHLVLSGTCADCAARAESPS